MKANTKTDCDICTQPDRYRFSRRDKAGKKTGVSI